MKALSAAITAFVVLGFAGAAAAQCAGYMKRTTTAQTAQTPVIVLPGSPGA